jgi:YfiR/HmsC-like
MTLVRIVAERIHRALRLAAAAMLLFVLVASPSSSASRAQEGNDGVTAAGGAIPEAATFDREGILKAAFVLNFARYTSWPPPGPGNRYHICIVGQDAVGDAMRLLDGKPLKGKTVVVRPAISPTDSSCQMLYISKSASDDVESILAATDGKPILTVSDLPKFVHAGGMIGLKIVDNHVRFDINAQIAKKVGLQLSAQLLRLADLVVGEHGEGG